MVTRMATVTAVARTWARSSRMRTSPGPCRRGPWGPVAVPRGERRDSCWRWSGLRTPRARPTPALTSTWMHWRLPWAVKALSRRVRPGRGWGAGDPQLPTLPVPRSPAARRAAAARLGLQQPARAGHGGRAAEEERGSERAEDPATAGSFPTGVTRGQVTRVGSLPKAAGFGGEDDRCWLCHPLLQSGYRSEGFGTNLLFAAFHLPDSSSILRYSDMMENLLRYIVHTLERTAADRYVPVCLSGAATRGQIPSFGWVKRLPGYGSAVSARGLPVSALGRGGSQRGGLAVSPGASGSLPGSARTCRL
ncbi:bcl-2/adenovirus E1B 19 kDa-interacting protein 2-like protein isoform 1-T2 [Chlamydotis macqueenii]